MLYDFHRQQNARRAGSVHATYLLSGVTSMQRTSDAGGNGRAEGGDVQMQSSPFMSSSTPHQDEEENVHLVKVVTLVREEHLEGQRNFHSHSLTKLLNVDNQRQKQNMMRSPPCMFTAWDQALSRFVLGIVWEFAPKILMPLEPTITIGLYEGDIGHIRKGRPIGGRNTIRRDTESFS